MAELSPTDSLLGAQLPRRRRGLIVLLLVLLAGFAALWLFTRFLVGTDSPYFSAPVERGDLTPTLSLRGTLHGEGEVTLAAAPSEADRALLAQQLSQRLGKQVVPHVRVNPAILGGVVVRVGDRVMDGSVRRKLGRLRAQLTAQVAGR